MAGAVTGARAARRRAVRAVVTVPARIAHATATQVVAVAVAGAVAQAYARGNGRGVHLDDHRAGQVAELALSIRARVHRHVDHKLAAHERQELDHVQPVRLPLCLAVHRGGACVAGHRGRAGAAHLRVRAGGARAVHTRHKGGKLASVGASVAVRVEGQDREAHGPAHKVARAP